MLMSLIELTPGEKDLVESRTFWGAVISGVGFALQHFNIAIDQVAWTNYAVEFAGFAVVLYGRYRANKPITSVFGLTLKRVMDQEIAAMKAQQAKDATASAGSVGTSNPADTTSKTPADTGATQQDTSNA